MGLESEEKKANEEALLDPNSKASRMKKLLEDSDRREGITRLNLDRQRRAYQVRQFESEAEDEESTTEKPNQMGWIVFLAALTLTFVQLGIEWLTLGAIGWMLAAPISVILWFMMRPYTKSLKAAKFIVGTSLVIDSLPFIGLLPVDILAIVYVFTKSRSALAQHLTTLAKRQQEKQEESEPLQMAA